MKAEILGSAQDGGVPHLGCGCDRCSAAREDPSLARSAASLRIFDRERKVNYLFDVSPDIRHQIGDEFIDGIFLSHAHLGHVTGLLYLGKESFNADSVPVYCSGPVREFLEENPPYRLLMDRGNIEVNDFRTWKAINVMNMSVRPVEVPNKGYVPTDTAGFVIRTNESELFYLTDIDEWTDEIVERVHDSDVAIVDGSFWSEEEIERYENVPHPTMQESMEVLDPEETEIYFTHMNHTNPVLDPGSEEREELEDRGFNLGDEGTEIEM